MSEGGEHSGRPNTRCQQYVRVSRACGEIDAETLYVIDRIGESGHFPFLCSIGTGIDMANMDGPTERPRPSGQFLSDLPKQHVIWVGVWNYQLSSVQHGILERWIELKDPRGESHAATTQNATSAIELHVFRRYRDGIRGTLSRSFLEVAGVALRAKHGDGSLEIDTVSVGSTGVASCDDPIAQTSGNPRH
jgi:hypothetical protein